MREANVKVMILDLIKLLQRYIVDQCSVLLVLSVLFCCE